MWIPEADSPDQPLSGVLEFLDPRAGVEAVTAPGDPYGEPFRVRPQAGLLVVFPSWLYHWVHPYAGQTPRIAISFNATPAPVAEVNASTPGLRSNDLDASGCPNPIAIQPADGETSAMWSHLISGKSSAALALASLALFVSSARAQAPQSRPTSLESEVAEMRAENGAIREQLRKLEEQQRTILQLMDELQRKLDGRTACDRTPIASCTSARARASNPGDSEAETRRCGNTTCRRSKHCRGGSLRRQYRFGENAGRRQGSDSFEVLGH